MPLRCSLNNFEGKYEESILYDKKLFVCGPISKTLRNRSGKFFFVFVNAIKPDNEMMKELSSKVFKSKGLSSEHHGYF